MHIIRRAQHFETEAHAVLGSHEASRSRVITLENTYRQLGALSLNQDELFTEALRCIENGPFRAAHVMAWAAFMDFLEEKLASDNFRKVNNARPKWNVATAEHMRETYPDCQIIDAARDAGLYGKTVAKSLHGLLSKRNECAHPSNYSPHLNETLGYVSELIRRVEFLGKATY